MKTKAVLFIIFLGFIVSACSNFKDDATLILYFGGSSASSKAYSASSLQNWPPADNVELASLNYNITLSNSSGKKTVSASGSGPVVLTTNPGRCVIEVTAYSGAELYAYGITEIVLKSGQNHAPITMHRAGGYTILINVIPESAFVDKDTNYNFTAGTYYGDLVNPADKIHNSYNWSVSGNTSSLTSITQSGVLTVGIDETAPRITVRAASAIDSSIFGIAIVTTTSTPVNAQTPVINTQPQGGVSYTVGQTATALTVLASVSDGGNLSYQWYKNTNSATTGGTPVGTNSTSYTPATSTSELGTLYYYVVVTNTNTGVNGNTIAPTISDIIAITVNALVNAATPNITAHPADATFTVGATATDALTVSATVNDGGSLSYQWYSNGTNSNSGGAVIAGATNANYTPPTTIAGITYYYVTVTNTNTGVNGNQTATTTSNTAAITVNDPVHAQTPNITTQPAGANYVFNATAIPLSVTASVTDGGTLSHQWYSNTSNSATGGTPVGTNSPSYTPPTTPAGTLYYYVVITNTNPGVTGNTTATVTSSVVAVTVSPINAEPPVITAHPAGATYLEGATATPLTVTANSIDSDIPLSYQWYRNTANNNTTGTSLGNAPGAQTASYTPDTSETGTTYYYVIVTNTIPNNGDGGTKTATTTSNPAAVEVVLDIPGMVYIPAGIFTMGSDDTNDFGAQPAHQVTLTKGFYMGKYQVTQEQYMEVMETTNPSYFTGTNLPVENVTWYDAVEFCNKLSEKEGLNPVYTIAGRNPPTGYPITSATVTANWNANGYRLPTEAEWEYACRAGTTTPWNTGTNITTSQANFNSGGTVRVGSYAPNAWGLYDMHGNVWEWCWDLYGDYTLVDKIDPTEPVVASGVYRVFRGGSCYHSAEFLRSAGRDYYDPFDRNGDLGFRVVRH